MRVLDSKASEELVLHVSTFQKSVKQLRFNWNPFNRMESLEVIVGIRGGHIFKMNVVLVLILRYRTSSWSVSWSARTISDSQGPYSLLLS